MRIQSPAVAAILFASLAHAQQTFDFTNKPSAQGLQEIATILRTVVDIRNLSVDSATATVTVTAAPDELAAAGWMIHQLDHPPSSGANSPQYVMPGKSDDVMQVFHLNRAASQTPQQIQEILAALRTVGDIQKVFNDTALSDLVVRGRADQLALADSIVNGLDRPRPDPVASRRQSDDVVRVFYLSNAKTPQQIQEILTTLRGVIDTHPAFTYAPENAMVVRSAASDIAACEFIIRSLDIADAKGLPPNQFSLPDGTVVGVYYPASLSGLKLNALVGLLRLKLQLPRTYSSHAAVAYRGTPDQIAKAELLIREMDQPEESSSAASISSAKAQ